MLLKNDSTIRHFWRLARVEELIPGADGRVCAPIVKVGSSDNGLSYLQRVIQHLIPIEVKFSEDNEATQPAVNQVPEQVTRSCNRTRRNVAIIGEITCRDGNIVGCLRH